MHRPESTIVCAAVLALAFACGQAGVLAAQAGAEAAKGHAVGGIVTAVGKDRRTLVVSCDAIPGYMDAMEMSFAVREPSMLAAIKPGMTVGFAMVEENHVICADCIQVGTSVDYGADPTQAAGLTALEDALDPERAANIVQPGHPVPDFVLTDQAGKAIHLSDFRGKVVVLTFGYSRCPFPQYCYRLSNNLGAVEKRFRARAGRELVLMTIGIDPVNDQGEALSEYAAAFHADPADWHFLTGPLPVVKQVAGMFGMNFWLTDGVLTHSLHTAVLDRNGKLVANIEGNHFSARQLGDLVRTTMDVAR